MKIKSSLPFEDLFLRRMISWCCGVLEMPVKSVKLAVFRRSRSSWGGCARQWKNQITVCVGAASDFPCGCGTHRAGEVFRDQIECLVSVTAHELYHIAAGLRGSAHFQSTRGYGRTRGHSSEPVTCRMEMLALDRFREQREGLLEHWSKPVNRVKAPVKSVLDLRLDRARGNLATWERKLKLASTKVRKYRREVRRRERQHENKQDQESCLQAH